MNIPENEKPSFSVLRPNQALSEGVPSGQADSVKMLHAAACTIITQLYQGERGAKFMALRGFDV